MARNGKTQVKAVAYMRTSSAAGVGADKDSEKRQRTAIAGFGKTGGFEIVDEFYDPAVSGVDPIETRPGFAALLDRIEGNGVRTVIVEDASRFARDLLTQELGLVVLIARGVRVFTANGDELTDSSDPTRVMMRQIAGAFHQYEKTRLVNRLRVARERTRRTGVKVEGRKSIAETRPEVIELARKLYTTPQEAGRRHPSLRKVAAAMAEAGHVTAKGKPYGATAVKLMLALAARRV
jgi:DNA invertase Pin-like site-specific DNA recombinase